MIGAISFNCKDVPYILKYLHESNIILYCTRYVMIRRVVKDQAK